MKHVVENRNPFPIQVFTILAIGVGTSSLWLGPVIHSLWERSQVPTSRVLPYWQAYGHWSVGLGIGILGFALLARSLRSSRVSDALVLFTCLALILLADRALLGVWGLPIWVPDRKLIYRLRPNQIDGKGWMRTNAYGQYDVEFPRQKAVGEFRGLFVGDSVTMGHGVDSSHVFSRQLENLLRNSRTRFGVHRMINTGVQGYSTEQEYEMLRESMAFHPDFVALGFCMNDLTEPFTVDRDLGGAGIVYGEVIQFKNPVISFLANETGFGQALLRLPRIVRHLHQGDARALENTPSLPYLATLSRDDAGSRRSWDYVLGNLGRAQDFSRQNGVPFVLLIFPFTFQLVDPGARMPQTILREYCESHHIDYIDFTEELAAKARSSPEGIPHYFLDEDHFTRQGHDLIAQRLLRFLLVKNWGPLR